ncbi:MAG: type IV conjugative transfer system protein TraL [Pseudomonadota bacterium]|nr:type IV conjugative transfer system protein TraL [Pseudomonadota bacterium]
MKPVRIPRYVDDPPHFLLWSADEMAPIGLGLVVGMFLGYPLLFAAVGVGMTYVYRRFRDGTPDGYFLHMLYWIGLVPARGKSVRNPYERRYLP